MKIILCLLAALLLHPGSSAAPPKRFEFSRLRMNGLAFTVPKTRLNAVLGKPLAVINPRYECGEFSGQFGGENFYLLRYRQAEFIGNKKHGYELQHFYFTPVGPARLTYGNQPLSADTTLSQLQRLLGTAETYRNKDGSAELVVREMDASATFLFKGGKLTSYRYDGVGC